MSSQAASISAWNAVFDWPSMVAALMRLAPRTGEQVGGLEQDRAAVVDRHRPPGRGRGGRGLDGRLGVARRGVLHGAEHVLVVVRLHDVDLPAAARAPPAVDVGAEVVLAPLEPGELGEQRLSLGAAGRVGQVGLVDRDGREGDGVHARDVVRRSRSGASPAPGSRTTRGRRRHRRRRRDRRARPGSRASPSSRTTTTRRRRPSASPASRAAERSAAVISAAYSSSSDSLSLTTASASGCTDPAAYAAASSVSVRRLVDAHQRP